MTPKVTGSARPDASMTLLTELLERPLDPGYAAAAGGGRASPVSRVATIAVTLGIGALLAVAALRTDADAPAADRGRAELLERVSATTADADRLAREARALRAENVALQARLGGAPAATDSARADALQVGVGAVPVSGPGLRVVLDGTVVDRDLQTVVNGLWLAGAEAVAINGQRLTSLSAIREAGQAVLVDYRPLTPPYTVSAIGDADTLATRLAASATGRYLQALRDNYGIEVTVTGAGLLQLPAASRLELRSALPAAG